jgi:hypothetical protein
VFSGCLCAMITDGFVDKVGLTQMNVSGKLHDSAILSSVSEIRNPLTSRVYGAQLQFGRGGKRGVTASTINLLKPSGKFTYHQV